MKRSIAFIILAYAIGFLIAGPLILFPSIPKFLYLIAASSASLAAIILAIKDKNLVNLIKQIKFKIVK